jgi:ankyrin repeat protein
MLRDCPALANAKTKDGVTPLMRAANKGHVKVCEILLSAGCPVNAKDSVNGWTALMQATHQRYVSLSFSFSLSFLCLACITKLHEHSGIAMY